MREIGVFLAVLLALVLCERQARADQTWDQPQNTGGMCPAIPAANGDGLLYQTPAGDIQSATLPLPLGLIVGDPNNVAFFDGTTGLLTDDNNFKWIAGASYVKVGFQAGNSDRLVVGNQSGTNNARMSVINDGTAGAEQSSCYQLFNNLGLAHGTQICMFNSGSTTYGHNAFVVSNDDGPVVTVLGGTVWQRTRTDGAVEMYDGTPAVSDSGTCAVSSQGGVLEFSCHGGAWTPFGTGGGSVTAVSATNPLFITGGASPTPNVVGHDLIFGGDTTTAGQNLGLIGTAPIGVVTSGGHAVVDGLTLSGGLHFNTGTGVESLDSFTCGANTFVSSSSTSGLACTQPAFSNLSGVATCGQLPALTGGVTSSAGSCATTVASVPCAALPALAGDVTSAGGTCTTVLANIPNDTPAAGDILFSAIAAPTTPAAGKARVYVDSGSKNIAVKNDAGTVNHGIQTNTCAASRYLTAVGGDGSSTCSTVAFSDVTGSVSCAQLPALTGGVTSSAGSCATTVASVTCGAMPALTGDTHTSAGFCVTVTDHLTDAGGNSFATSGTFADGQPIVATVSGHTIGTSPFPMKMNFSFGTVPGAGVTQWLITGFGYFPTTSFANEYPNDFQAGHVQVRGNMEANGITAGTLTVTPTRNGSSVAGSGLSYTSASTTGVTVGTLTATGSASSSDTYGLVVVASGGFAAATGATATFQVILSP